MKKNKTKINVIRQALGVHEWTIKERKNRKFIFDRNSIPIMELNGTQAMCRPNGSAWKLSQMFNKIKTKEIYANHSKFSKVGNLLNIVIEGNFRVGGTSGGRFWKDSEK